MGEVGQEVGVLMARRRPGEPTSATEGGLLLPPELAIYRAEEWPSSRDHYRARSAWFRRNGIDPADWRAIHPILCASQRAHARTPNELPALDRHRRRLIVREQGDEGT